MEPTSQSQGGTAPGEGMSLAESQLAAILDIADDAVIVADAGQRIRYFNRGAERIFGYGAAEVLGQPLETLLPEAARAAHRGQVERFGAGPEAARHMGSRGEIAGRRRDGTPFPAEASICKVGAAGGQLYCAILRDVSERKRQAEALRRAKEAAEAATQAKSMFLANMSHEIRTPLNAVIGMTSLLLDTAMGDEQRDYAQTIRASGEALLATVNDILDYSKIELGKLELEQQPFELRRCIEESLDLLSPKAAEANLNLAYIVEDSVPETLVSDVTRLRQVLVNLLGNAVKFTHQGEVLVSVDAARAEGGYRVHFAVKDTGIGIPADRVGSLFQSFSQVDASTTRRYGGTGLGLAISRRLAELMGGTMWVESEVGRGSTFHFTIQAAAAGGPGQAWLREGSPQLTGKRMLIVDDNTTNRRILVKHALAWGMLPSAAASAIEALDLIRHGHAFDVGVLDLAMPEMDGMGLALEIRKFRDARSLPLIMLSSMGQRQRGVLWERAQFAGWIGKPIKASQLHEALLATLAAAPEARRPGVAARLDAKLAQRVPLAILVAEDNAVNQKVVLRILERMGYRADVAANGAEVLEALDRQNYDVILMDVHMPELDGMEATRRIRQRFGAGQRPRIIAMTADALAGDRDKCLAAGMDDYLAKPLYVQELQAALEAAAGPEHTPLDLARIRYLRSIQDEASPRLLEELVGMFNAEAPKHIGNLWKAVTEGNGKALAQAAHRFRSSIENIGARGMAELCTELERMGQDGTLDGAQERIAALDDEYERVRRALDLECERPEGRP